MDVQGAPWRRPRPVTRTILRRARRRRGSPRRDGRARRGAVSVMLGARPRPLTDALPRGGRHRRPHSGQADARLQPDRYMNTRCRRRRWRGRGRWPRRLLELSCGELTDGPPAARPRLRRRWARSSVFMASPGHPVDEDSRRARSKPASRHRSTVLAAIYRAGDRAPVVELAGPAIHVLREDDVMGSAPPQHELQARRPPRSTRSRNARGCAPRRRPLIVVPSERCAAIRRTRPSGRLAVRSATTHLRRSKASCIVCAGAWRGLLPFPAPPRNGRRQARARRAKPPSASDIGTSGARHRRQSPSRRVYGVPL